MTNFFIRYKLKKKFKWNERKVVWYLGLFKSKENIQGNDNFRGRKYINHSMRI